MPKRSLIGKLAWWQNPLRTGMQTSCAWRTVVFCNVENWWRVKKIKKPRHYRLCIFFGFHKKTRSGLPNTKTSQMWTLSWVARNDAPLRQGSNSEGFSWRELSTPCRKFILISLLQCSSPNSRNYGQGKGRLCNLSTLFGGLRKPKLLRDWISGPEVSTQRKKSECGSFRLGKNFYRKGCWSNHPIGGWCRKKDQSPRNEPCDKRRTNGNSAVFLIKTCFFPIR